MGFLGIVKNFEGFFKNDCRFLVIFRDFWGLLWILDEFYRF